MSDIRFACPQCGTHLVVEAASAGVDTHCPTCAQRITIPHVATQASEMATSVGPPASVAAKAETGRQRLGLKLAALLWAGLLLIAVGALLGLRFFRHRDHRETILDRKVHIAQGTVDVPNVPPWCSVLKLERRRVDVGGCELYCETSGRGAALVLIHGGPGGTHHDFHPHFEHAANFASVVYYDQRGCGQSDYAKARGYTVDQAVDDLDRLRDALNVPQWIVLGWSYGGVVAQCYTVKHPEHVAGMVLVGSAPDAMHLALQSSRQQEFISSEERWRIGEIQNDGTLSLAQLVYNAHLNGDWKRQHFYKPTPDELARSALYAWKHAPTFRGSISGSVRRIDLRGMFEECPTPILLAEGNYDLTWGADKPEKLRACFPGCQLVRFERSAHAPFADEADRFFSVLHDFMKRVPPNSAEIAKWKERIAARQAEKERSLPHVLETSGWGRQSSEKIATRYSEAWLDQISGSLALLRLGFALYDAKEYQKALVVFSRLEKTGWKGVGLVWQGHMLDLLGRRAEAIVAYRKAVAQDLDMQHSQYEIILSKEYVQERIQTPFQRRVNHDDD